MRTEFHALEEDHLQILHDLAVFYNAWNGVDPSKLGNPINVDARTFGLGDGVTSDYQALQDAFTEVAALAQWGDRSVAGVGLEIPPGVFFPTSVPGDADAPWTPWDVVPPEGEGGYIIVRGSSAGGTTLQAPNAGTGRGKITATACTRTGNVFTVTSVAHGLNPGDPIVFNLNSRANPLNFVSTNVVSRVDANTFTYVLGDDGAANLDLLKVAVGAVIDKMDFLINATGFRQLEFLSFRDIAFTGPAPNEALLNNVAIHDPNNLPNAQIGYGVRKTSRVQLRDCLLQGWQAAEVLHGAARGTAGVQNTDHNSSNKCNYSANVDHILFHSNQRFTGGIDIGGSRDHHWPDCQWGVCARGVVAIADSGSFKGGSIAFGHDKSAPFPIFIEGVAGVLPNCQPKLSLIGGTWKNESPGQTAIAWDESLKSRWDQSRIGPRSEVSIAVNGGPSNLNTGTLLPWPVTTTIAAGVQTVNLPAGHGLQKGYHVAIGSGITTDGAYVPSLVDGAGIVKTVSGNVITLDRPDLDTRTGTDGAITGGTTFKSNSAKFDPLTDNGRVLVATGIPAGTTVTVIADDEVLLSAASTNATGLSWSLTARTLGSTAVRAGEICGFRFGFLDNVRLDWQAALTSGGNEMARSLFWWHFDAEPNACTFDYQTVSGTGASNAGKDLPSITIDNPLGRPATRTVFVRGLNRFWLRLHDPADAAAIMAGGPCELVGAGLVRKSAHLITNGWGGIALQPSPASGAVTVTSSGIGKNGLVVAARPYLWVAMYPDQLPIFDCPSAGLVTASPPAGLSATIVAGNQLGDAGDGVGAWNGTTSGIRIVGTATGAISGGKVPMETCAPWWTP